MPIFRLFLTFSMLLACAPPVAAAAEVPADLAALLDDETAFLEALRSRDEAELARIEAATQSIADLLAGGDGESASAILQEARESMEGIRAAYEAGLERYPNNAQLQNYYGELLYDQVGEEAEAVERWHKAKELDPKLGLPYNNLGIHYMHVGAYALGLENLDMALKLDPDHPDFLFNMVQAYMNHAPFIQEHRGWKSDRIYREAMKLSVRAAKQAPEDYEILADYALNFWKAEPLGAKADWKKAAAAWAAARVHARNNDEHFHAWLMEARAWIKLEKPESALKCLDEALKIHPDSEVARRLREQVMPSRAA